MDKAEEDRIRRLVGDSRWDEFVEAVRSGRGTPEFWRWLDSDDVAKEEMGKILDAQFAIIRQAFSE